MKDVELMVKINAEFQWIYPPKNIEQMLFREQTNVKMASLASKLEQATAVILLEMANIVAGT